MAFARKRKAASDDRAPADNASPKRQRVHHDEQTPQTTTEACMPFIATLRDLQDKDGRSITELFLELPDRKLLPDYYKHILLPISIDGIKQKLQHHEYQNVTAVESDFRRMIANAKKYNDVGSIVFSDAERIRKLMSNWFKTNNPDYKNPRFTCAPTPIPTETNAADSTDDTASQEVRPSRQRTSPKKDEPKAEPEPARKITLVKKVQPAPPQPPRKITLTTGRTSLTAAKKEIPEPEIEVEAEEPFVAPTESDPFRAFSQAQWHIMDLLAKVGVFHVFLDKPPRSLTDYYRAIKKPTSINSVKKLTLGKHGHDKETGISDFATWAAFDDEASHIWLNAQHYNEDGSEMYSLAVDFKKAFHRRLEEARVIVQEPPPARLKLNARPKTVLQLGSKASPPADTATPEPSNARDMSSDALAKHEAKAPPATNGNTTPRPEKAVTPAPPSARDHSPALVKSETNKGLSPAPQASPARRSQTRALDNGQPTLTPSMPRPASPYRTSSPRAPTPKATPQPVQPRTFDESYSRSRKLNNALLANVNISMHPNLILPTPFDINVPPLPKYTQQSLAITLPATHYYLQVVPMVSSRLLQNGQYKLFVTVNNTRVAATTRPLQANSVPVSAATTRQLVYDAPLIPGVNRIEVEVAAVSEDGGVMTEKVSCFANLMKP